MTNRALVIPCVMALLLSCSPLKARTFRVATYNLEGYLDHTSAGRSKKSEAARAGIRDVIRSTAPDVLALQEVGSSLALEELRRALKEAGLDFPHAEYLAGRDTNIHLAVLSRFPFISRRQHTNDAFLVGGRQRYVSRGFAEVQIKADAGYEFTLLTAHLKSKRAVPQADEEELRLAEAKLLRARIDTLLEAQPEANLVVLGDFNDTKDSEPVRRIIGRGKTRLLDTRPAERDPATEDSPQTPPNRRGITWTHFYDETDTYSRIDYILLSPGMAREWVPEETCIETHSDWGLASDHRLLVATFASTEQ